RSPAVPNGVWDRDCSAPLRLRFFLLADGFHRPNAPSKVTTPNWEPTMSDMSPAEAIFFAALERPPGERAAYLDEACAGDAELRARIEKMLFAQPHLGTFLDQPAAAPVEATGPHTPREDASH